MQADQKMKVILTKKLSKKIETTIQERRDVLLKLLPDWENAAASGLFAKNFFLDHSINSLKQETSELFAKAGKIIAVDDVVPESQLKGHFLLKCENTNVLIHFSLTPEVPPLIQQCRMSLFVPSQG